MKKIITCALTALMAVSALSLPVYAQDASTEFSFVKKNDPTYTVSIPSSLALSEEGTPMTIEAKDVAYLEGIGDCSGYKLLSQSASNTGKNI